MSDNRKELHLGGDITIPNTVEEIVQYRAVLGAEAVLAEMHWPYFDDYVQWTFECMDSDNDASILLATYSLLARQCLYEVAEAAVDEVFDFRMSPPSLLRAAVDLGQQFRQGIERERVGRADHGFDPRQEPLPLGYIDIMVRATSPPFKFYWEALKMMVAEDKSLAEIERRGLALDQIDASSKEAELEGADHILRLWQERFGFEPKEDELADDAFLSASWDYMESLGDLGWFETFIRLLQGRLARGLFTTLRRDTIDLGRKQTQERKRYDLHNRFEDRIERGKSKKMATEPDFTDRLVDELDRNALGLDLDALTPGERRVVEDVLDGFRDGFEFDSKLGRSFHQRWGPDYDKNIKAWSRGKAKLKSQ